LKKKKILILRIGQRYQLCDTSHARQDEPPTGLARGPTSATYSPTRLFDDSDFVAGPDGRSNVDHWLELEGHRISVQVQGPLHSTHQISTSPPRLFNFPASQPRTANLGRSSTNMDPFASNPQQLSHQALAQSGLLFSNPERSAVSPIAESMPLHAFNPAVPGSMPSYQHFGSLSNAYLPSDHLEVRQQPAYHAFCDGTVNQGPLGVNNLIYGPNDTDGLASGFGRVDSMMFPAAEAETSGS
jgi:hypothetical protein